MKKETQSAIGKIVSAGSNDHRLIKRGERVTATVQLGVGNENCLLRINQGRITECDTGNPVMPSYTFAIRSSEEEWHRFWQPVPPPGSQDLFALLKRRVLQLDGDLYPFMSHLFYFKFLLAAPRER